MESGMSPAKVEVFKPNHLLFYLRPGQDFQDGLDTYIGTEDGFYSTEWERETDDGYTQSQPRQDYRFDSPRPFVQSSDWQGVRLRITAIPMSELPL
jgi:hypothetical protein